MKLPFGYELRVQKSVPSGPPAGTQPIWPGASSNWSGWFNGWIQEPFTGAWQRNSEVRMENVMSFSTVYACVTLIASDIGKLDLDYVEKDKNSIWQPASNPSFSPVLRRPNRYQIRQKFIEQWMTSKLIHGNTYVLKERDKRNVVVAMYVLDPMLTRPMVAPDGSVWYQLSLQSYANNLVLGDLENIQGVDRATLIVPASEIIHDINVALYHPLCGVSPISACGLPAVQGIRIQQQSTRFFENSSRPSGILSAPGVISDDTAKRLKDHWENNYTGQNSGKVAVLGDGLKFEQLSVNAVDAELINQLKLSSEQICSAFHVPPFMVGIGEAPSRGYGNVEALYQIYYSQCLQTHIESIEDHLDDGLGLSDVANQDAGTAFCLDDLLRMDTSTQYKTFGDGIRAGLLAPNEARLKLNLPPVTGGDTPYLQQQNFSLEALDKRDSKADPFGTNKPQPQQPPPPATVQPPPKLLPAPLEWSETTRSVLKELVASNAAT